MALNLAVEGFNSLQGKGAWLISHGTYKLGGGGLLIMVDAVVANPYT